MVRSGDIRNNSIEKIERERNLFRPEALDLKGSSCAT